MGAPGPRPQHGWDGDTLVPPVGMSHARGGCARAGASPRCLVHPWARKA